MALEGAHFEAVEVDTSGLDGLEVQCPDGITKYHVKQRMGNGRVLAHNFEAIGRGTVLDFSDQLEAAETLSNLVAAPTAAEEVVLGSVPVVERTSRRINKRRSDAAKAQNKAAKVAEADTVSPEKKRQRHFVGERSDARAQVGAKCDERTAEQVLKCSRPGCNKTYTVGRRTAYNKHVESCQGSSTSNERSKEEVLRQISDSVGMRSAAAGREAESLRAAQLSVPFSDLAEFQSAMTLADCGDHVEVCGVSPDACLRFKVYVTPGSKLLRVGEATVLTLAEVELCLQTGGDTALRQGVMFELAPPPVPRRGYARQIARATTLILSEEQEEFLRGLWRMDRKMTAAVMCERMATSVLFDGKEELLLDELDITRFLKRIYAEQKREKEQPPAGEEEDMMDGSVGQATGGDAETAAEGRRRAATGRGRGPTGGGETPARQGGGASGRGRGTPGAGKAPPGGLVRGRSAGRGAALAAGRGVNGAHAVKRGMPPRAPTGPLQDLTNNLASRHRR